MSDVFLIEMFTELELRELFIYLFVPRCIHLGNLQAKPKAFSIKPSWEIQYCQIEQNLHRFDCCSNGLHNPNQPHILRIRVSLPDLSQLALVVGE